MEKLSFTMDYNLRERKIRMKQTFNDFKTKSSPSADHFHQELKNKNFDFAAGVPCGVLKHFILNVVQDPKFIHINAQHEPEVIGIVAGAYLGGKKPIIYMQNSGLLKSINEIGSLLLPCQIPILGIVSYRGCPGEDAPQHFINGRITKPILDLLGIKHIDLEEDNIKESVEQADEFMSATKKPFILLAKRGWSSDKQLSNQTNLTLNFQTNQNSNTQIIDLRNHKKEMLREEALDAIIESARFEDAIFSTTGLISRSLYERYDSPNQFYNTGSFGQVSSEGLGFALAKTDIRTIIIDGDASVFTNLGTLATIGRYKPQNLVHIVVDNESYGSCSEEKSASKGLNIAKTAALHGYSRVYAVDDISGLNKIVSSKTEFGPILVQAKIKLGGRRDFRRPLDLAYISRRFRSHFEK